MLDLRNVVDSLTAGCSMGCLTVLHFCSAERPVPKEYTGCVEGFKEQLFIATQTESGNQKIRKSNQMLHLCLVLVPGQNTGVRPERQHGA